MSSNKLLHDPHLARRRDESNFNAFYENVDLKPKRADTSMADRKNHVEDPEAIMAKEIQIVSKTLDEVLRKNDLHIDYVDMIRGEYVRDQEEQDKNKDTKINNLRDVYVVGLLNQNEPRTDYYHGDATKTLKIRVEEKVGLEKEEKRNRNAFESVYEIWQEKMNKMSYKLTDPKYELIEKGEYEAANKISRIETFLKKNEMIAWSSDRIMDYYLYCEKGVTEGVFIKVDVR